MALQSVATKKQSPDGQGSTHNLWLRGGDCLTVGLDRNSNAAPASTATLDDLHQTLLGLGKAVAIIGTVLKDGVADGDTWHFGVALHGLADAIALHVTLAEGVSAELHRSDAAFGDMRA